MRGVLVAEAVLAAVDAVGVIVPPPTVRLVAAVLVGGLRDDDGVADELNRADMRVDLRPEDLHLVAKCDIR